MASTNRIAVFRLFAAICSYTARRGPPARARASGSSISKKGRSSKPNARATIEEGNDWISVFSSHHLVVVELTGVRDLRLGADELLLQREEVLVRLEVRIVLHDGQQLAEPGGDLVLGVGLVRDALGSDRSRPGLGDAFEELALVGGVALHGLDEVGDQVGAPTELDVDLGPAVLDPGPKPHQPVEIHTPASSEDHDDPEDDPERGHRDLS